MNNRRFFLALTIVFVIVFFGFIALKVVDLRSGQAKNDKMTVLTTFTVLADMAQNVAGDRAEVESLTKPGTEIHGYEPTPQDMVRLQKADVILDNGMNLEKWAEKLYQTVRDVPHVTLSDGISPIAIAEGPYQNKPNPHAWMSPKNALLYVDAITKTLSQHDAKNAAYYRQNAENYKAKIQQIDTKLHQELNAVPASKRYLATCEGAFSYLIRDYGLKELYLWPINADALGTPQQVRKVIEVVKKQQIPTVFCESTVSPKAQQEVARDTGAAFGGTFYVDSLSGKEGGAPTYLDMLTYNTRLITEGLNK